MRISEIKEFLDAEILCGSMLSEYEIISAFGSDLMSDVLAYAKNKTLLLTGLTNAQVVRTAEMLDLKAIVFVRGKKPDVEVIELAAENGIVLLVTRDSMYTASGKLYSRGLSGIAI